MNYQRLVTIIKHKRSFLCVGLDTDSEKIPSCVSSKKNPLFEFNKNIIDATADITVAYKINIAFYECHGANGWNEMAMTARYIKATYPDMFLIADAKRGDIGNTSDKYAAAFFKNLPFDAITVAPYMGYDSVSPFLRYENKWVILLALTSNSGAEDFQQLSLADTGEKVYERVIKQSALWAQQDKMMYVVGATRAPMLHAVRKLIPDHFLLVPGVGAQGGSLAEVAKYGMNKNCGLLVNSSRAILYADRGDNYHIAARQEALKIRQEMSSLLSAAGL